MRLIGPKPKKFWSPSILMQTGGKATALGSYTKLGQLTNSNSLTLTGSIDIGATAQLIVAAIANSAGGTVTSATVGGVALTAVSNAGNGIAIFADVVALSGSQTVTSVFSTGQFNQKGLLLWSLNGLSSTTVKATALGTATDTISVNSTDLMFSIYHAAAGNGGTYATSTQAPAAAYNLNGANPGIGGADWTISVNNASFTVNPTVSGGSTRIISATWV